MTFVSVLVITPKERKLLGVFTALAVFVVGPIAGAVLASQLKDDVVLPAYWSSLLAVQGISALPLVAIAALVSRSLVVDPTPPTPPTPPAPAPGPLTVPPTPFWAKSVLVIVLAALIAAIAVALMSVYEIAVTQAPTATAPGVVPNQGILWLTSIGTGMTICAVAAGLLAVALDKINT